MSLLEVSDLRTWFATPRGMVRAVDGVSLSLDRGHTLGIVGESGSGKSALVRSIAGLHLESVPARFDGRVEFDGVDLRGLSRRKLRRYWGARIGVVFQNPMTSLNPVMRIGRQLTEPMQEHLGASRSEARAEAMSLLASVGISDPERRLREYPHVLSGGMRQRVAIAIAVSCKPALIIADEPTTALDVTVQAQILALLAKLQAEHGLALIFVSHDLAVVSGLADEIAVMYAGRVVERGPAADVIASPRMPYTGALLGSAPDIDKPSRTRLAAIPGRPPTLVGDPPLGCPFAPRCERVQTKCTNDMPPLAGDEPHRSWACWFPLGKENRELAATSREETL